MDRTTNVTIPLPKIQIPRLSSSVIARAALVETLSWDDAEEGARATLVCGPAGYGKTTLLAMYARRLRHTNRLVGWVSCDRHDCEASLLWQAVLSALSAAVRPLVDAETHADPFCSLTPPPTIDQAFIAEFTQAVDDFGSTITLVLDDFQEVADPTTLAGVSDFLANLPDGLHLIIGTRRDPSIPLHRLSLEGRLRTLRAKDLAFCVDEVDEVLRGQQMNLDPPSLTLLWRRTEGWPAAVRLASLALTHEPDPVGFVTRFAGDDSAVAGYLVEEILGRQSATLQQFLLDTCVAEELTDELAAALSDRADAGALLNQLAQANALVQRLGRSGEWYRYHALLRSFLVAELRRRDLTAAPTRHRRAAIWFEENGFPARALEHAAASGDESMIESMLSREAMQLLLTGHGSLVMRAITESPSSVREAPDVLLITAIVAYYAGDRAGGDQALKRFRTRLVPAIGPRTRQLFDVARLYQARLHGDVSVLPDIIDDNQPDGDNPLDEDAELLMLTTRGALRLAAGDYVRAKADLRAALELSRARGRHRHTLDCMNQLAGVTGARSEIDESTEWARQTREFAAEHGWANSPQLAYSYLLAAWCAYLRLDLQEASRHSAMSMAVLEGGAIEPEAECASRWGAAAVGFDRYPQRRAALRDMDAIWQQTVGFVPSPALTSFALGVEMRMCLTLGDRGHAAVVIARAEKLLPATGDTAVLRALDLLDRHQYERAGAVVAPVLTGALTSVVVTTSICAWLIEALVRNHAGMVEMAHRALLTALEIGDGSDVMRPFYDCGMPVRELLLAAVGRTGHLDPFLDRLLAACRHAEAWQETNSADVPMVEQGTGRHPMLVAPLTSREIEVLRELPSMLTAEEIAEEHQVSVNTVKTHMRSLYRKLGAANRRDAVACARRLSLL